MSNPLRMRLGSRNARGTTFQQRWEFYKDAITKLEKLGYALADSYPSRNVLDMTAWVRSTHAYSEGKRYERKVVHNPDTMNFEQWEKITDV